MGSNLAPHRFVVVLTEINCGKCGGTYAINERYRQEKEQVGDCWNCPYCQCGWGYANNGENARLKRELAAETKRKEWAEQDAKLARDRAARVEHSARATRGHLTRVKRRVAAGVCPCCNRTFKQLARHMSAKHPAYAEQSPND